VSASMNDLFDALGEWIDARERVAVVSRAEPYDRCNRIEAELQEADARAIAEARLGTHLESLRTGREVCEHRYLQDTDGRWTCRCGLERPPMRDKP
jgi:hypothetical protein